MSASTLLAGTLQLDVRALNELKEDWRRTRLKSSQASHKIFCRTRISETKRHEVIGTLLSLQEPCL